MSTNVTRTSKYRPRATVQGTVVYSGGGSVSPSGDYYTKTELDAGSLDTRYYTETELDGGQLNILYYTETELDPAATLGNNVLDARYYTETELLTTGVLDARYYTETESDNLFVHLTGDETVAGVKTFSSNIIGSIDITISGVIYGDDISSRSVTFSSGFTGDGYKLAYTNSEYTLEVDNLVVRKSMSVYELEIRKIRATNGTLWVTNGVKATSGMTASGSDVYFEYEEGDANFVVDDIIRVQQYTGTDVFSGVYRVSDATISGKYYIQGYDDEPFTVYGTSKKVAFTNVDFDTFSLVSNSYYVITDTGTSATANTTGTLDLTDKVGEVSFSATWTNDNDSITLTFTLRNSGGTQIATPLTVASSVGSLSGSFLMPTGHGETTGCYVEMAAAVGGNTLGLDFFIVAMIDRTLEVVDVVNMDFVRIGNATDTDRQGSIMMTSDESDAPYLDVYAGVDNEIIDATDIKLRLGNLAGITDADFGGALSGYGLYCDTVYLKGNIYATAGHIGGWSLDTDAIYTGAKSTADGFNVESAGGITLVDDGSIHAPGFYIDADGTTGLNNVQLSASNEIDGTYYGGIKIEGMHIYTEYSTAGKVGHILINMLGDATGQRYTLIGDGQENILFSVGPYSVGSAVDFIAGADLNVVDLLTTEGGRVLNTADKTATYTLTDSDDVISNNGTTGNRYVYLPVTSVIGQTYYITNVSASYTISIGVSSGTKYIVGTGSSTTVTSSTFYTIPTRTSIKLIAITSSIYAVII